MQGVLILYLPSQSQPESLQATDCPSTSRRHAHNTHCTEFCREAAERRGLPGLLHSMSTPRQQQIRTTALIRRLSTITDPRGGAGRIRRPPSTLSRTTTDNKHFREMRPQLPRGRATRFDPQSSEERTTAATTTCGLPRATSNNALLKTRRPTVRAHVRVVSFGGAELGGPVCEAMAKRVSPLIGCCGGEAGERERGKERLTTTATTDRRIRGGD